MSSGKGTKWDGDAHTALAVAFFRVHGTVSPEEQAAIVQYMSESGFQTTWDAIRYGYDSCSFPPVSTLQRGITGYLPDLPTCVSTIFYCRDTPRICQPRHQPSTFTTPSPRSKSFFLKPPPHHLNPTHPFVSYSTFLYIRTRSLPTPSRWLLLPRVAPNGMMPPMLVYSLRY